MKLLRRVNVAVSRGAKPQGLRQAGFQKQGGGYGSPAELCRGEDNPDRRWEGLSASGDDSGLSC